MTALAQLQGEVEERLHCGQSLSQVERDVIDGSDLSEEHKSALWLYGWAVAAKPSAHRSSVLDRWLESVN